FWHKIGSIHSVGDCVNLPGGYSYGDYLRCGAIARCSPIKTEVINFAKSGKYVIGICNGFQILTESGLLPGTLLRNNNLKFICKDVFLKVENNKTPFTSTIKNGDLLRIPIAHGDGNYFADSDVIDELESSNRIVFRYANESGEIVMNSNPNGSINNIAGIISKEGNVLGMMPHPERYSDSILGCNDGLAIFNSIVENFN
ncbi:MAG: phosphoribosylformylglycinamidine synthase subunit PurQ, partial [Candidatus Kapabacteria bacterium]|nr:phosphoribosylformylglycinamidine synthase subunit PurQ [Candidatus Kapabacteria bacterium]